MKSKLEIEIKKIRKQLKVFDLMENEKELLRKKLKEMKREHKKEKNLLNQIY